MHELRPTGMFQEPVHQWIGRRQGPLWLVGVHETPSWDSESIGIRLMDTEARDEDDDDDDPPSGRTVWARFWNGVGGTAVCAPDGRVLVTDRTRRITIVGPDADPKARDELSRPMPQVVMSKESDVHVHNCSAISPGFALLATQDASASGPPLLIALDDRGREQWRAAVPFRIDVEVEPTLHRPPHPPIALGDGRVLVAGAGLACFANGKLLWSRPSPARVGATVLASKAIAVATGRGLQILDPDGRVRDEVELPGEATVTTSPAVASDGTLYVGTKAAVYAVR
jgi:outer membrane protein assembly factor BamB